MSKKAFSLVELIVVIAIVGILSAIAIPAYKQYSITARISSQTSLIKDLVNRSIIFSQAHGRFANSYDLGLSDIPGDGSVNEVNAVRLLPDFLSDFQGGNNAIYDYSNNCGRYGAIELTLDSSKLGFDPRVASNNSGYAGFYTRCIFWHYEGVIYNQCFYSYGNTTSRTDNILSGWINMNTTSGWDLNNLTTYVYSQPTYINATCQ